MPTIRNEKISLREFFLGTEKEEAFRKYTLETLPGIPTDLAGAEVKGLKLILTIRENSEKTCPGNFQITAVRSTPKMNIPDDLGKVLCQHSSEEFGDFIFFSKQLPVEELKTQVEEEDEE